jgi:hypothetical protein
VGKGSIRLHIFYSFVNNPLINLPFAFRLRFRASSSVICWSLLLFFFNLRFFSHRAAFSRHNLWTPASFSIFVDRRVILLISGNIDYLSLNLVSQAHPHFVMISELELQQSTFPMKKNPPPIFFHNRRCFFQNSDPKSDVLPDRGTKKLDFWHSAVDGRRPTWIVNTLIRSRAEREFRQTRWIHSWINDESWLFRPYSRLLMSFQRWMGELMSFFEADYHSRDFLRRAMYWFVGLRKTSTSPITITFWSSSPM